MESRPVSYTHLLRKLLNVVLTSPEMAGRTEREVYQLSLIHI